MNDAQPTKTLDSLRGELREFGDELAELAGARWQLLRLELDDARRVSLRLAISLSVFAMLASAGCTLLLAALGDRLDGVWGIARWGWFGLASLTLLILSGLGLAMALRRFRREFVGLRDSLEELHEDAVWVREWFDLARSRSSGDST